MADYWALSAGNWSNVSNWLTGTTPGAIAGALPGVLDDVYANNRNITIDINTRVNSIRNIRTVNITAGGTFFINNGISLSAYVYGGGVTTVPCLQFSQAFPAAASLYGSLCAGDPAFLVADPRAFENSSSGTFDIFGNTDGFVSSSASTGIIRNTTSGRLNLYGNHISSWSAFQGTLIRNVASGTIFLSGDIRSGGGQNAQGILNEGFNGVGNITIIGNVSGGSGPSGRGGIFTQTPGVITIIGNVFGGTGAPGIGNFNCSSISITGNVFGGPGGIGIDNISFAPSAPPFTSVRVVGDVFGGSGSNLYGITTSNSIVTVTGRCVGGTGSGAAGVLNQGQITCFLGRAVGNDWGIGSTGIAGYSPGVTNTNLFGSCFVEAISCGSRGAFPTAGSNIYITRKSNNSATLLGAISANSTTIQSPSSIFLYSSISGEPGSLVPLVSNVRFNTVYDLNAQRGTLIIPTTQTVLCGVPVDTGFGSFFTDLPRAWQTQLSAITATNSFGIKTKNIITLPESQDVWLSTE
jgi:hypothetical protein